MKNRLDEKQILLIREYTLDLLRKACYLNDFEEAIKKDYKLSIKGDKSIIKIANMFYSNRNIAVEEITYDFVKDNLKNLLLVNDNPNLQICPAIGDNNMNPDNFVKNGTLVLVIDRTLDFNLDPKIIVEAKHKMDKYKSVIEKSIAEKLIIPVRIIFNDILIRKKKQ